MSPEFERGLTRVLALIDSYRDEMVAMQAALTAIPAIAPESGGVGEGAKAAWLKAELTRLGMSVEEYRAPDGAAEGGYRPNLVARLPAASGPERVWVLTHMDVVPPGERSLWSHDPFQVVIKDGRCYGRGTEDNQQAMVSSIFAARALMAAGITPRRSPCLALVADEETGSQKGLAWLLEAHGELFGKDDWIVVPDIGSPDGSAIEIAEKSILWLKLTLLGRQCHASRPAAGINTLEAAARLIVALTVLRERFGLEDALYEPPESTFSATKKEANVPNINTIPGEDVFYLDCRVLPQYRLGEVLAEINRICADTLEQSGVRVKVEEVQAAQAPPPTPAGAPVVRALARAVKELRGIDARPIGVGGGTVAAFFRRRGLAAACWATQAELAHQPDEYCLIDNMVEDAKVFAHLFLQ
jgi:succinyl-diaminopimelate desuccinylase